MLTKLQAKVFFKLSIIEVSWLVMAQFALVFGFTPGVWYLKLLAALSLGLIIFVIFLLYAGFLFRWKVKKDQAFSKAIRDVGEKEFEGLLKQNISAFDCQIYKNASLDN